MRMTEQDLDARSTLPWAILLPQAVLEVVMPSEQCAVHEILPVGGCRSPHATVVPRPAATNLGGSPFGAAVFLGYYGHARRPVRDLPRGSHAPADRVRRIEAARGGGLRSLGAADPDV